MAISNDFIVKSGLVVKANTTVPAKDSLLTSNVARAIAKPSLDLNFTRTGATIDQRISFTRSTGANYTNAAGVISYAAANQPRIDYGDTTSTGQCLGLLIEEQRTNLYKYSNDFYTAASFVFWDGSLGFRQSTLGTNTTTIYALSVYLKVNAASSGHTMAINLGDGPGKSTTLTAITTGTWTRIITTGTVGVSGDFADIRLQGLGTFSLGSNFGGATGSTVPMTRYYGIAPNGNRESTRIAIYNTQTNALLTDIELWGFQVEAGTFPTTLITTGASSVTRAGDLALVSGQNFSSFINQTQGTFFIEAELQCSTATVQYPGLFAITDGQVQQNTLQFIYGTYPAPTNIFGGVSFWINGGNTSGINNTINSGQNHKTAVAYSASVGSATFSAGTSAGSVATFNTAPLPITNVLSIGSLGKFGSNFMTGHIKRLTYWPTPLTAAQLTTLMSY
jgi:hypothetical protein